MLAGQEMNNRGPQSGTSYSDVLIHRLTSRPEVWEALLDMSLVQIWTRGKTPKRRLTFWRSRVARWRSRCSTISAADKTGQFLAASAGDSTPG